MEIVILEPDDAEYVEDLANHHYPPNYPMSVADIADNLEKGDKTSFCFGVEADGKLLGYLMAWIENTMVEGKRERVLLVDDIVLSNRARHQLFRLLDTTIKEMAKRGFGKLPIEGSARPSSSHTFMGHPEALERLGYELACKAEYHEPDFGEDLTWVRFEPIEQVESTIDEDDYLEIQFEGEEPIAEIEIESMEEVELSTLKDDEEDEVADDDFDDEYFEDDEDFYDEEDYDDEFVEEDDDFEEDEDEPPLEGGFEFQA